MPASRLSYPELMLPWFVRWSYTWEGSRNGAVVVRRRLSHHREALHSLDKRDFS